MYATSDVDQTHCATAAYPAISADGPEKELRGLVYVNATNTVSELYTLDYSPHAEYPSPCGPHSFLLSGALWPMWS